MAEVYDRDALAAEIEQQAAQMAEAAEVQAPAEVAGETGAAREIPVAEAVEPVEAAAEPLDALEADAREDDAAAHAAHAALETPTEVFGRLAEEQDVPADPTQAIDPPTEAIPVQAGGTTPMPNPFPEVQPTTPLPEPAVTTAGYDVQAVDVILETPAAGEVRDPFAPATAAAAAGTVAAGVATASAQAQPAQATYAAPAQPASPYQQASYAQPASQQPTYATPGYKPTYAQPGAYQGAVQHQPFAPDPTVNPYESSLTQLSGGMKFGWLVVGLLLGIPGMIIAWLANADKHPQVKHDAIMFSVIGFCIALVLDIIGIVAFTGVVAAAVSSVAGYNGLYF